MAFKVAVFGLSGNPPQNGHLAIAQELALSGLCDRVLVVPCGARPDKPDFISGEHRFAMARLLCQGITIGAHRVALSGIDVFHERYTTTIDLMRQLDEMNSLAQHQIVIGSDLLLSRPEFGGRCDMETWEEGDKLMTQWPHLILRRPGVASENLRLPRRYDFVDAEFPDISSTEVRARIARGESIEDLVPSNIARYIKTHNLYRKE